MWPRSASASLSEDSAELTYLRKRLEGIGWKNAFSHAVKQRPETIGPAHQKLCACDSLLNLTAKRCRPPRRRLTFWEGC